jgi:tetratricopeptide (TPR) repeat protein
MSQTHTEFRSLVADAVAHHREGRLVEAETLYRAALAVSPGHAPVTHNLGVIAAAQGRHREAIGCFDAAIAADPGYIAAHYNRAVALMALGEIDDAIGSFSRACSLDPQHYEAHRALGFLWLSKGDLGRALDHFARTYELRRGDDRTGIAAKSLTTTARHKLLHDVEQFRYLASRSRDGRRFEALAQHYEAVARDIPEGFVPLSEDYADRLGEDYNTAVHVRSAPQLGGGALAARPDRDAIVQAFEGPSAGAVAFDELLTPAALLSLRRFLLESTIWHDFNHIGGFVASYLEDGLGCPLLLQVADDLRRLLPELLGEHPLTQAWAFKALEAEAAVEAHADDAAISVNFWIAPTAANLNPDRGGMVVCRAPPPSGWELTGYESDRDRIVTFLEQNRAECLIVPYRENRAVLFKSRLFHASDVPKFAPGYENHRINVTLLFGGA